MNANVHGYPYQPGDIAYVIAEDLTIREGTNVSHNGSSYVFLMADNQQHETFTYDQLYGLKSNAQIAVQTKYTSPTPSVSFSPSPTPSRTPQPSSTQTITPTPSSVIYPNVFDGASWTGPGTTTPTTQGLMFSAPEMGVPATFTTSASVTGNSYYNFNLRFIAGTCRYADIEIVGIQGTQSVSLYAANNSNNSNSNNTGDSGTISQPIFIPAGIIGVTLNITLYSDSNYNNYSKVNTTFTISGLSLVQFVPYVAPSPTPSGQFITPTPSASGGSGAPVLFDFMARLNHTAVIDPTFVNLGYMSVNKSLQTADGKIYVAGGGTYGSINYLTRLKSDGTVDHSFADLQLDNEVKGITQTSDGKIYVIGLFTSAAGIPTTNKLIRLNSNGTFDSTYSVDLGPTDFGVSYTSILQAANGKIYLSGSYQTGLTMGVRRLNSDGSLDSAYSVNMGYSTNGPLKMYQTVDGKIYLFGTFTSLNAISYSGLGRLNSDGTVDTAFVNVNTQNNNYLSMTQTADGKIYPVGLLVTDDGSSFMGIRRLNSDGTIDTSVPSSFTAFATNSQRLNTVAQTADGKIYVGGLASAPGHNNYDYFLRLNSDGSFDYSFSPLGLHAEVNFISQTSDLKIYLYGDQFAQSPQSMMRILDNTGAVAASPVLNGFYTPGVLGKLNDGTILGINQYQNQAHYGVFNLNTGGGIISINNNFLTNDMDNTVTGYTQDVSGNIYIAGSFTDIAGVAYGNLARLNSDGVLDTSFIDIGVDPTQYFINTISKTADNKLYVVGNFDQVGSTPMTFVQRLNSNGTIDSAWPNLNLTSGSYSNMYNAVQTADGKIYLCGSFGYNSGQYKNLMRLHSDGTVDTTFVDLGFNHNAVFNIFQTSTGKIYVFGDFNTIGGHSYTDVARLNADGTVDTTFIDLGLTDIYHTINKMIELENGKFMIIGSFDQGSLSGYEGLARLNANGTVDTSFTNLFQNYNSTNGLVGLGNSTCMVSGSLQTL